MDHVSAPVFRSFRRHPCEEAMPGGCDPAEIAWRWCTAAGFGLFLLRNRAPSSGVSLALPALHGHCFERRTCQRGHRSGVYFADRTSTWNKDLTFTMTGSRGRFGTPDDEVKATAISRMNAPISRRNAASGAFSNLPCVGLHGAAKIDGAYESIIRVRMHGGAV
jgi:hypothetical protein